MLVCRNKWLNNAAVVAAVAVAVVAAAVILQGNDQPVVVEVEMEMDTVTTVVLVEVFTAAMVHRPRKQRKLHWKNWL